MKQTKIREPIAYTIIYISMSFFAIWGIRNQESIGELLTILSMAATVWMMIMWLPLIMVWGDWWTKRDMKTYIESLIVSRTSEHELHTENYKIEISELKEELKKYIK